MRQVVVTIVGGVIVAAGVVLLVLPGPGLLVVFAGLTVLATQWEWADRLARRLRERVSEVTHRHRHQPDPDVDDRYRSTRRRDPGDGREGEGRAA